MDLPTYEEAVQGPDAWALLEQYLDASDLVALCIVNRQLYNTFAPILWGDPLRITATLSVPFTKTNAFMECAKQARKNTCGFVISLDTRHLSPLQVTNAQDFAWWEGRITSNWIIDCAGFFENLRSVIIDDLEMKEQLSKVSEEGSSLSIQNYILIFSANGVWSFESSGFMSEYRLLDNIMYLDISYTMKTEAWTRGFSQLHLPNLRIAKLCGLRLTDQNLPDCILRTGYRLWSLDLSDNLLTDEAIERLLENCCLPPIIHPTAPTGAHTDEHLYKDAPTYQRLPSEDHANLEHQTCPLRPDHQDSFMAYLKAKGDLKFSSFHVLDENDALLQATGLTHLYLSNNKVTSLGIRNLLHGTNRLQILDAGSVRTFSAPELIIPHVATYAQPDSVEPLLRSSNNHLENLRIHHSIITHVPTLISGNGNLSQNGFELQHLQCAELKLAPTQRTAWRPFSPLENNRIKFLTLSDIPRKSFGATIESLEKFLSLCAAQDRRLKQAAQKGNQHHRRAPELLPGLRKLRLEFLPEATRGPAAPSASVSGDQDANQFLIESAGDFSFFESPSKKFSLPHRGSNAQRRSEPFDPRSEALQEKGKELQAKDVVDALKTWRKTEEGKEWTGKMELAFPYG